MILDGYSIADKNIVMFNHDFDKEEQIQPNGVDLRVGAIYLVNGRATIPRDGKALANFQVSKLALKEGIWTIGHPERSLYYIDFLETIAVPEGYCGIIHTRSSLERAGVHIDAGLYDTGFTGCIGGSLRFYGHEINIEYGARIAQITLWAAKFRGHRYDGRYQGTDSQTAIVT